VSSLKADTTKDHKAKAVPLHATKALGGRGGKSSYSFSTSALDGVSDQRLAPTAL
jgi:hypothetical protein